VHLEQEEERVRGGDGVPGCGARQMNGTGYAKSLQRLVYHLSRTSYERDLLNRMGQTAFRQKCVPANLACGRKVFYIYTVKVIRFF
jgi:hypothetical protein